jgi:hypothetical protein
MFTIYHIPNFIHSDGSIGKIGCANNAKKRVNQQGYNQYEILEEHIDVYHASDREIELQKQYGYKVDCIPYYVTINAPNRQSSQIWASKLGKIQGNKNVLNGHLEEMRKKGNPSLGGQISSSNPNHVNKKKITCPHCGKEGQYPAMKQWHYDNCKFNL